MKYILAISLMCLISCAAKEGAPIDIGDLPKEETAFQKRIIGQLTGAEGIKTMKGESLYLNSRWNQKEKDVVRNYLKALFQRLEVPFYQHHYQLPNAQVGVDLLIEPLAGTNIYTLLPATSTSEEYVVIGAHYDTDGKNFPGAIDNGSGVALICSVLRQAKSLENRTKNVLVVFFDQEEENISAGSIAFAQFLIDRQYRIHSVHSYDLIGWDGDGNREVQLELPSVAIEAIYQKHARALNIPLFVTQAKSSDYYSFVKAGINAVGMSQAYAKGDVSGKKDSPEDQYHLVNFEYLTSSTTLAFEVLKDLLDD